MHRVGRTKRTIKRARRRYLKKEEKKLQNKVKSLQDLEHKFKNEKMKALVLRYIQKELVSLRRKNKLSLSELLRVVNRYDACTDAPKKKELSGKLRILQLRRMREAERIRTLIEVRVTVVVLFPAHQTL